MFKKIFILVLILFFQTTMVFAQDLSFIYINGSNNNNAKSKKWFLNGIEKFHPELKTAIENNAYTYKYFLKDGKYTIESEPSKFFWGYESQNDFMFMKEKANLMRSISPLIAYGVRNVIAEIMHDAIWIQKPHNMIPVVQELDEFIKQKTAKGNKVVLLGYSAGTFITLEYLINKIPYINIADYFKDKITDSKVKEFIAKNPRKNTCLIAFVGSNLTNATPLGKIAVNPNMEEFKTAYLNMDSFTDKYCIPENSIAGVINYASPIPLFYSDVADKKTDSREFASLMYKYLIEHDFFFLTVNYADDPLGFPNGVNRTNGEIKSMTNLDFDEQLGFFYDYSKAKSGRTFAGAHTSYWNTKKRFSKAIVKGYTEGRKFQYDQNYQEEVLKSKKLTKKDMIK